MSTDETPELDTAPVFDTRAATKNKELYLILDDGTKAGKKVRFEITPVSSDVFLNIQAEQEKLQALQKAQGSSKSELNKAKELMKAYAIIDDLIMPLVQPNKPFRDWAKKTLDSGAYVAYRQVMSTIIEMAYDGIRKTRAA